MNIIDTLVSSLRVDTAWGPAMQIDEPFKPLAPGETSTSTVVGGFMKPKVTVFFRSGEQYVSAPYGDPGETKWPLVQVGMVVLALGALTAVVARSRRRRRLSR